MKIDKDRLLKVFFTFEMIMLFILGIAMLIEAVYPVDRVFINPTPIDTRIMGGVFGGLIVMFSYIYIKEHDMLKAFKKTTE